MFSESTGSTRLINQSHHRNHPVKTGSKITTTTCQSCPPALSPHGAINQTHRDKCEHDKTARNHLKHTSCAERRIVCRSCLACRGSVAAVQALRSRQYTVSLRISHFNYFHLSAITICFEMGRASSSNSSSYSNQSQQSAQC